ncbi:hypothetical protein QBC46DRAFT_375691 [Diplogelasinospora grovesii]|uniref:HNH nuclease domain-containing protein n=1 Tax=Diplogelasinospora grovesii TaxID=303347 RepID=A0AAN6S830_9PEZI|nr:hypothetical protein QBC46DRAFT_375691 [Diplogelasinospora grovesii]
MSLIMCDVTSDTSCIHAQWTDPLRNLAPVRLHPVSEPEVNSILGPDQIRACADQDPDERNRERTWALTRLELWQPGAPDDTAVILEALLRQLPKQGQEILLAEMAYLKATGDWEDYPNAQLRKLRNHLVDTLLQPVLVAGKTPPPEFATQRWGTEADESAQSGLRAASLRRDGYRCCLTGDHDDCSTAEDKRLSGSTCGVKVTRTRCAHILPVALGKTHTDTGPEVGNKAAIWRTLHRYFPGLKGLGSAATLIRPENALTLSVELHAAFESFTMALQPMPTRNKYFVHWFPNYWWKGTQILPIVTLQAHDSSVPLPEPEYFEAHFRIARILHASKLIGGLSEAAGGSN